MYQRYKGEVMMSNKTITVELKSNYGRDAIYPACMDSRLFAKLANTTTLTSTTITLIESLGYSVQLKPQTLEGVVR
tara:strand:- start:1540 stop:1767 length:228 start_codon:yes stop_codon:yes gene_type:complete